MPPPPEPGQMNLICLRISDILQKMTDEYRLPLELLLLQTTYKKYSEFSKLTYKKKYTLFQKYFIYLSH